ncbi:MAG: chemotaxis protein CheD [Bacteroidetes bacterium]|nr:chemotaxis protein CheD [Bacteroidota bacterium]
MENQQAHYLYPSALFASRSPGVVTTILGSCVSVCLWDSKLEFGGINHYMLPFWNGMGLPSPKYGNIAISKLVQKMHALGGDPANLTAKVIGGGEVLQSNNDLFHIGPRNIQIAFEMLKDLNIPVIGKSVGGSTGRKIQFDTHTGKVRQSMIVKNNCYV